MKSRLTVLTLLATVVLLVFGLWLERSHGLSGPEDGRLGQGRGGQRRADRKADKRNAEQKTAKPTGPGRTLAFDVRARDHRATSRYLLEITHPSGDVSTHDLKKPSPRKRTITASLPDLKPGKYKIVVIAESPRGKTRSEPLPVEIQ